MDYKKEKLIERYNYELSVMFSNDDFTRFFGPEVQNKIIKYSQLINYKDIIELLPNDKDYKIFLTESEYNSGHWTAIMRVKDKIIYFDSYGVYPDFELNFISKIKNKMLGQGGNQIQRLMKTSKKNNLEPVYSKTKYQSHGDHINTCGRWVSVFIMLMNMGYDLKKMKELFDKEKNKTGKPYDIIAIDFSS
jgi:hypothetical protein